MLRVHSSLALIAALLLVLLLSGCPRPPDRLPPEDFSVSAVPAGVALVPGESGGTHLALERLGGFDGPIEVAVLGLEAAQGVTATVRPAPVYGESAAVVFRVDEAAPPQRLELSLLARSRTLERSTPLLLSVGPREEGPAALSGRLRTPNAAILIPQGPLGAQREIVGAGQGGGPPEHAPGSDRKNEYVPGELLVQYRDSLGGAPVERLSPAALEHYLQSAQAVREAFALEPLRAGDPGRPDLVRVPDAPGGDLSGNDLEAMQAVAARLSRDPRVLYAEPNYYLSTASLPADPRVNEQWAAAAAGLPVAWAQETGATNPVVVAVIDSGFDLRHEDLAPRFLPGYDFCNQMSGSCSQPGTPTNADPSFGSFGNAHGSHVAGIVGAIGGNGRGIAGAAHGERVRLLPIKIFNGSGGGATTSSFIDGIRWAVGLSVTTTDGKRVRNPHPARIINLSLGVDNPSNAMQGAINEARARGAVVIAATGNAGAERVWSPAAAEGVIGVGSHNQSFLRSCFSNYGLPGEGPNGPGGVDIVAGGGESCGIRQSILSTVPRNAYGYQTGTSMAAPLVSGVAALILSQSPELSPQELERRLLDTAYFDPSTMTPEEYGAGALRADRALGLPGPGDPVIVRVPLGDSLEGRSGVAVLDLYGGSSPYSLSGLPLGPTFVQAGAAISGSLRGERSVTLEEAGMSEVDITLDYLP